MISIKTGPVVLFSSSRDYYKKRVEREKPDGRRVSKRKTPHAGEQGA